VTGTEEIIYRVNAHDEIVYVNEAWERFAAANAGDALRRDDVIAMPIWEFIVDAATDRLYRDLMRRVRSGLAVRFTIRCDSPTVRRLLEIRMAPYGEGGIEFCSKTVFTEERVTQELFDSTAPRADAMVRVCSWCNRVQHDDLWKEVEEVVRETRVFERLRPPMVTHGICEECSQRMMDTIAAD
jgi:hypothetical protein